MHKLLFQLLLILATTASAFCQGFSTVETRDKVLSIVEPVGWVKTSASNSIEFALTLNDQYPLTLVCVKEKGSISETINKVKQALPKGASIQQSSMTSATGNAGTTLIVKTPLEKAGSYVYQYYYIFYAKGACYALIGTSGVCQENGGPEQIFNAIATTVKTK